MASEAIGDATGEVIETLVTVMAVNYVPYLSALTTTYTAIRNWAEKVGEVVGEQAAGAFLGLTAITVASAAATLYAWHKVSGELDEIARKAERIGTSVEFLQSWSAAALLAGRSSNEFSNSIEQLHKRIQDMSVMPIQSIDQLFSGSHRSFTFLGLSPHQLNLMDTEEQLLTIADALSQVKSKSLQASIARDLGLEYMLPHLVRGREGIEELQKKLERFNRTLTGEQKTAIMGGVAAWREFKLAMEGVALQIAASVAPVLEFLGRALTYVATWVSWLAKTFPTLTSILSSFGIILGAVLAVTVAFAGVLFMIGLVLPIITNGFWALTAALAAVKAAILAIEADPFVLLLFLLAAAVVYALYLTGIFEKIGGWLKGLVGFTPEMEATLKLGQQGGMGGDNPYLAGILANTGRSASTQEEIVAQLKKAAPPHMAYVW